MDKQALTQFVKAEAQRLGFTVCGVAQAEAVAPEVQEAYMQWIQQGCQAGMDYLERNLDKRFDPRLLVPGVQSIICVALNYYPATFLPEDTYQIAWYAYGKDYHDVMRERLGQLLQSIQAQCPPAEGRCFCDTAPVLERYWAQRAGLGWQGRNTQLIIPGKGSTFFLGEIFLNQELEFDAPMENHCGTCQACVELCPNKALSADRNHCAAPNCLSYLTIENRGPLPEGTPLGNRIYGCDQCQKACPHNRLAQPTSVPEFTPSSALLNMTPEAWQALTREEYQALFKGSAVKRAKFEGLQRNIKAI